MGAILTCESLEALRWFNKQAGISVVAAGYSASSFPATLASVIAFWAKSVGLAVASTSTLSEAVGSSVSYNDVLIFVDNEVHWRSPKSSPKEGVDLAIELARMLADPNYSKNKEKARDEEVVKSLFDALKKKPRAKQKAHSPPASKAKQVVEDPRVVLGVSQDCTWAQLRSARNRLLAQYHPDKVAELGLKIREIADAETKRITAAFDQLAPKLRPKGKSDHGS